MAMELILDNLGNPDFGQDPERRLPGTRRERVTVKDLAEASRKCLDYIAKNNLGGGNWVGGLVGVDGKAVASVGYNGVAWPPGEWRVDMKPLYDPHPKVKGDADPNDWEHALLDLGGGLQVSVTGCFRTASWRLRGDTRRLPSDLLMGDVRFARDAEPEVRRESKGARAKALLDTVEGTIRTWYAEPEGKAMILGNEVKDRRASLAYAERQVARQEADLIKARDASVVARDDLAEAEDELAAHLPPGPHP